MSCAHNVVITFSFKFIKLTKRILDDDVVFLDPGNSFNNISIFLSAHLQNADEIMNVSNDTNLATIWDY